MSRTHWRVETGPAFRRQLRRLDRPVQARILAYLHAVAALPDPRLRGKGLTANRAGQWRYRVGDHRVIVELIDDRMIILALTVGHRSTIY